jgi:hypothetical protein
MAQSQPRSRREFRFPRPAIFFMVLVFVSTLFAIETARNVSAGIPDLPLFTSILPPVVMMIAVPLIAAAVAYAIRLVRK